MKRLLAEIKRQRQRFIADLGFEGYFVSILLPVAFALLALVLTFAALVIIALQVGGEYG